MNIRRVRFFSPRDPFRLRQKWASVVRARRKGQRVLFEDPVAVLSVPWFISRLDCRAVITVRHPAGVVSSLKDWATRSTSTRRLVGRSPISRANRIRSRCHFGVTAVFRSIVGPAFFRARSDWPPARSSVFDAKRTTSVRSSTRSATGTCKHLPAPEALVAGIGL